MSVRVLVVEDNPEMAQLLQDTLAREGFETVVADAAGQAARIFDREPFDLAILDVNLKEGTGHEVCRHIRAHPARARIPVIMLTANIAPDEKAEGFASGADNYLTKPINVAELLLWVKALLRRVAGDWTGASVIKSSEISINPETHTVESEGQIVRGLTCMEFNLLCELARSCGKTMLRKEIEKRVWEGRTNTNTLEVHIKNLRKKLGERSASHIVTVKGVGYRFE